MNAAKGSLDQVDQLSQGVSKRQVQAVSMGMMAVGGLFTGAGAVLTGVSDKIEKSQATLRQTIENTGRSWNDYKDRIDAAVSSGAHFGKGSSDTQDALAKLTAAYQDPTKALAAMSLVTDIAAFKHISLADAAAIDIRMHAGAAKTFKEFGINVTDEKNLVTAAATALKAHEVAVTNLTKTQQALSDLEARDAGKKTLTIADEQALTKAHEAVSLAQAKVNTTAQASTAATAAAAGATKNYDQIMATQLAPRLKGIAEAQANTFGGHLDEYRTRIMNLAGSVGKTLGPALVVIGPILMGLGGAMQMFTMFTMAGAAAVWAFLWPILAVIAGVALLVGAFIFAYNNFKPFHAAVDALAKLLTDALGAAITWLGNTWNAIWPTISNALKVAWEFMKPILNFLVDVVIVEFRIAILLLQVVWNAAWAAIHGAIAFYGPPIMAIFGLIKAALGPIGDALGWLKNNVWDPLWNGIVSTVRGVWNVIKPIFDAISGAVGGVMKAVGSVGNIGSTAKSIFSGLPIFAEGGWVPGSGEVPAVLHGGEFVVSKAMMAGGGSSSGGDIYVTVQGHVFNWNDTAAALADPIRQALLRQKRTTGTLGLA